MPNSLPSIEALAAAVGQLAAQLAAVARAVDGLRADLRAHQRELLAGQREVREALRHVAETGRTPSQEPRESPVVVQGVRALPPALKALGALPARAWIGASGVVASAVFAWQLAPVVRAAFVASLGGK